MNTQFYMPVKVIEGTGCVTANPAIFAKAGKKAMIVTGRHSAKANGSLDDVVSVLKANHQSYCIFDRVKSNPDIDAVYAGAAFARDNNADFIIGIGGGSPLDAAKAIALLAVQEIPKENLFSGEYAPRRLPMILIPTTAGTGSEVTQYAILTNHAAKTKTTLSAPFLFADAAFLDGSYMSGLSQRTTINTAIDALTHLMESFLATKATALTRSISLEGIRIIASLFPALSSFSLTLDDRTRLLTASNYGGIVIAQTGTTAVHSMGYSLTYFQEIEHGRANGLLIAEFLKLVQKSHPDDIAALLDALGAESISDFAAVIGGLLGKKETITRDELKSYASIAIQAKNIANCIVVPSEDDLFRIYCNAFDI